MSRARVLRQGTVLAIASALAVQFTSGAPIVNGFDLSKAPPHVVAHISGTAAQALGLGRLNSNRPNNYFPGSDECETDRGDNIKVNQSCLNIADPTLQGRAQAQNETSIAVDPNNPRHVVASYNDYRRGDGTCGVSYSLDGARSWNDSTVPNGFTLGNASIGPGQPAFGTFPREYWEAAGDTSVAFDTKGNAYLSCQVFQRGQPTTGQKDLSSAFLVFRSTHNSGASWNFPGHYTTFFADVQGESQLAPGLGTKIEDKALMTVDNHVGSPFQDRIYVTWTEFDIKNGTAFIYEVHSNDYGETFSPRVLVSGASALCKVPASAPANSCDNNQFSDPFTGPDGALYVAWSNFNSVDFHPTTVGPALYQVLIARSTDGGETFSAPQKVSDYYELPDCDTYQGAGKNPGVACVPEKGSTTNSIFRAANYPSGAVSPRNPKQVVVSIGSYINRTSNEANGCIPTGTDPVSTGGLYTGVKTPGACNNKVVVSTSNDGGATFNGTTTNVRNMPTASSGRHRQAVADQWFQWLDIDHDGRVAVAYYDRQYGDDETTGFSDQSLAGADADDLLSGEFGVKRVTTSSNPPPTQFNGQFMGDYNAVATVGDAALPLWSDTRNIELFVCPGTAAPGVPPQLCTASATNAARANDEDIFVARVSIPTWRDGPDDN